MFHRIGDIDLLPIDPSFDKAFIEQLACGAHERLSGEVLVIARLFADEYDLRFRPALAEDRLRAGPPQRTRFAIRGGAAQFLERRSFRNERRCAPDFSLFSRHTKYFAAERENASVRTLNAPLFVAARQALRR